MVQYGTVQYSTVRYGTVRYYCNYVGGRAAHERPCGRNICQYWFHVQRYVPYLAFCCTYIIRMPVKKNDVADQPGGGACAHSQNNDGETYRIIIMVRMLCASHFSSIPVSRNTGTYRRYLTI